MLRHLVLGLSLSSSPGAPPEPPGLSPEDVMRMQRVTAAQASPDGSQIFFVRQQPRPKGDKPGGAYSHLYIVAPDGSGERLLMGGTRTVRSPSWSPDGRWITYLDQEGDEGPLQVHALPMAGGEAFAVTDTEHEILAYEWSPDGRSIAYTTRDEPPAGRKQAREDGFLQVVVDEDWVHTGLHLWDCQSRTSLPLTSEQSVISFEWFPGGDRIIAGIAPRPLVDDRYMFVRLHEVDLSGSGSLLLVENPGKLGDYEVSPDGRRLAFISAADRNDPHAGSLYCMDLDSGSMTALTPELEGMVHEVHWLDAERLRASISVGVHSRLVDFDTSTGEQVVVFAPDDLAFEHFTTSEGDAHATTLIASSGAFPDELFTVPADPRRLTDSNPWLAERRLGRQEVTTFSARDGLRIEGLLMYPLDYQPGTRYPLVIVAHGGPESHFQNGWNTDYARWGQLLCARGYFAWYPNYRSSTGRGVAFAKADHGDPMGKEFEDHLDAILHFDAQGLIDRSRVGIGGGSYGGYTAAFAATRHSEHFAAAVSFVPFVDIRTKWYTTDIPWEFYYVHYQEKWPHEQHELLASRSPLTYAAHCKTPLLLLGGTEDTRVHPSQPFMLYRAVKTSTGTPVRYVQYPGEGHGNRSNVSQYDYCLRTLQWFDHYLGDGARGPDEMPGVDVEYAW